MAEHPREIYLENIPLEEARSRLHLALDRVGRWTTLDAEDVSLLHALGRITAAPVWAKISSPHYHAAAMDGYAVQAANTHAATETRPIALAVGTQAYPVNTGDPLPTNTNAVIMIEDVQQSDAATIMIRAAAAPYQHVRLMGEDMVATELVLPINHKIRPVDLGALAGCGHTNVTVYRQPRITIIPTGGELVPATDSPQPGQIIEYNSLVLRGQILEAGGIAHITDIVPDEIQALKAALKQALITQPDLVLVLAGSSAGSKDFTASVIRELGKLLVHGVAVRPGHPVIIGLIDNTPIIGIPGYPVSAALTGELFIQPLLAHWLGIALGPPTRITALMTRKLTSPIGDDDFVRVTLAQIGDRLLAAPLNRGAGVITSLVRADGLAHIPRFVEGIDQGQPVEISLYQPLHQIKNTVAVVGSHDPMLDLLGQFLTTRHPTYRLTSAGVGSLGGLVALRRQEAHLAGIHLLDPQTGEYNIAYLEHYLPNIPVQLITFAHREQGFIVAKNNPLQIYTFEDLTRARYVNRQPGAGTRILLDYELGKRGINPQTVIGYEHLENTHMAVAAAIQSGTADCGMGVRSAAVALGLDFVSVGWERYDLVVPKAYLDLPGVNHLLTTLTSSDFQQALAVQPGYNTQETGKIQHATHSTA